MLFLLASQSAFALARRVLAWANRYRAASSDLRAWARFSSWALASLSNDMAALRSSDHLFRASVQPFSQLFCTRFSGLGFGRGASVTPSVVTRNSILMFPHNGSS